MDFASVLGLLLGIGLLAGTVAWSPGASLGAFVDPRSLVLVVGGSLAATLVCFPLSHFRGLFRVLRTTLLHRPADLDQTVAEMISLSETARRQGLLALDARLAEIKDPLLALGVQMVIDGTPPEVVEDVLRMQIQAVASRHRAGKAVVDQLGRFTPAFGLIGSLVGLILMMGNVRRPEMIAPALAVALTTTFYGVVLANLVFLPIAEKLAFVGKQQVQSMEIMLRGLLAIQAGEHPRVVEQRLGALVPEREPAPLREAA